VYRLEELKKRACFYIYKFSGYPRFQAPGTGQLEQGLKSGWFCLKIRIAGLCTYVFQENSFRFILKINQHWHPALGKKNGAMLSQ
jgi:hypothetical protein